MGKALGSKPPATISILVTLDKTSYDRIGVALEQLNPIRVAQAGPHAALTRSAWLKHAILMALASTEAELRAHERAQRRIILPGE